MEKRFQALRIIGAIFKVLAWVLLVGGILGAILMAVGNGLFAGATRLGEMSPQLAGVRMMSGLLGGFVGAIGLLFGSVLQFLMLYATGDAIFLALAIEENTRETAWYLKGGDTIRR